MYKYYIKIEDKISNYKYSRKAEFYLGCVKLKTTCTMKRSKSSIA